MMQSPSHGCGYPLIQITASLLAWWCTLEHTVVNEIKGEGDVGLIPLHCCRCHWPSSRSLGHTNRVCQSSNWSTTRVFHCLIEVNSMLFTALFLFCWKNNLTLEHILTPFSCTYQSSLPRNMVGSYNMCKLFFFALKYSSCLKSAPVAGDYYHFRHHNLLSSFLNKHVLPESTNPTLQLTLNFMCFSGFRIQALNLG